MTPIRIGTRPSRLAVAQAQIVSDLLTAIGYETIIVKHQSRGDLDLSSPLYSIGKTGVFVEDLNRLIIDGEIDIAVHSAKDVPYEIDNRLEISGVPPRGPYEDALVSEYDIRTIPNGSTIGTSSLRRKYQILYVRPDLKVVSLRGNVDTRIQKMKSEGLSGIVMAKAAIDRIELGVRYSTLDPDKFVPAPNQGIIAIVSRKGSEFSRIASRISDPDTYTNMDIERAVISGLRLGCSTPVGVLSRKTPHGFRVKAQFFSMDGKDMTVFDQQIEDVKETQDIVAYIKENIPEEYGYNL